MKPIEYFILGLIIVILFILYFQYRKIKMQITYENALRHAFDLKERTFYQGLVDQYRSESFTLRVAKKVKEENMNMDEAIRVVAKELREKERA